jgi:hypothetical protein
VDPELSKALKIAREKVKSGHIKDFQLILDVTGMSFVWVSEEAAREHKLSVPMLIGEGFFETTDISPDGIRNIILEITKSGGRYTMPLPTLTGAKNIELEFKPIYVSQDRPFLVGSIIKGL